MNNEDARMSKEDYNEYMLDLFKQSTFQAINQSRSSKESLKLALEIFREAASVFNQGIASELLVDLDAKYSFLPDKTHSYPYMFWKTPEAEDHVRSALKKHERVIFDTFEDAVSRLGKEPSETSLNSANKVIGIAVEAYASIIIKEQKKLGDGFELVGSLTYLESTYRNFIQHENLKLDPELFPKVINELMEKADDRTKYFYYKGREEIQKQFNLSSPGFKPR